MKTLIIMLIFSMAFIGFHINGYKHNILTNEPEKNENINYNENENENENENINVNETIYNPKILKQYKL